MASTSYSSSIAKYDQAIGGFAGGLVSTAVCHPMELLRIRYSVNEGRSIRPQYNSYLDATRKIWRAAGIRGLYQGVSPNALGSSLSWGLYFAGYHKIKEVLPFRSFSKDLDNFLCGFITGSCIMVVTNPIWVVKTRLCLQYESAASRKYSGMIDCLSQLFRKEGFKGAYRGFVPGLLGNVQGSTHFMIYNHLKDARCRSIGLKEGSDLNSTDYVIFTSISKILANSLLFPYLVLRTRMQDHNVNTGGLWQTTVNTVKREGFLGLYKGFVMANLRQLPATIVTFFTYESVSRYIRELK